MSWIAILVGNHPQARQVQLNRDGEDELAALGPYDERVAVVLVVLAVV